MRRIKDSIIFRMLSLFLIITFTSLDMAYAYPPDISADASALATPPVSAAPLDARDASYKDTVKKTGVNLGTAQLIGNFLFEDRMSLKYLAPTLLPSLDAALNFARGDSAYDLLLSRVQAVQIRDGKPVIIDQGVPIPQDSVILIPRRDTSSGGIVELFALARKPDSGLLDGLPGRDWVETDKYKVKRLPKGYEMPLAQPEIRTDAAVTASDESGEDFTDKPDSEAGPSAATDEQAADPSVVTRRVNAPNKVRPAISIAFFPWALLAMLTFSSPALAESPSPSPSPSPSAASAVISPDQIERDIADLVEQLNRPGVIDTDSITTKFVNLGEPAVPYLIKALDNRKQRNCDSLISALGEIGGVRAKVALLSLLSENYEIRKVAAIYLGKMGEIKAFPVLMEISVRESYHDNYSRDRNGATEALRNIGKPAILLIIKELESKEDVNRRTAAKLLGEIGGTLTVPSLARALNDSYWQYNGNELTSIFVGFYPVREAAYNSLRMIIKDEAFIEFLKGVYSMNGITDNNMSILVNNYLSSSDSTISDAAGYVLTDIGQSAVPALLNAAASDDDKLSERSESAILLIGEPALPHLVKVAASDNGNLSRTAYGIMVRIDKSKADSLLSHRKSVLKTYWILAKLSLALSALFALFVVLKPRVKNMIENALKKGRKAVKAGEKYWSLISKFPAMQKLKEKTNRGRGNEFDHVELVVRGVESLMRADYGYLLTQTKEGYERKDIDPEKSENFKSVLAPLRDQVLQVVGDDKEAEIILKLMPILHDIGKACDLEDHVADHWTRGADMLEEHVFSHLKEAGYELPDRVKDTLRLLVKHHITIGEVFMAANLPGRTAEDFESAIGYIDSMMADIDKEGRDFRFITTLIMANTLGDMAQGLLPAQVFINQFREVIKYSDREYLMSVRAALTEKLRMAKTDNASAPDASPDPVQSVRQDEAVADELFEIVESNLNNNRAEYIEAANRVIRIVNSPGMPQIVEGAYTVDVMGRIDEALQFLKRGRGIVPEDIREDIAYITDPEKIAQFEADGAVAAIISMARRAKKEDQKLLIGLETEWIPGVKDRKSYQSQAIGKLLKEMSELGKAMRSMGLDNVEIVTGSGATLRQELFKKASEFNARVGNIVMIASIDTVSSVTPADYLRLTGAAKGEVPLLAGIDTAALDSQCAGDAEIGVNMSKQLRVFLTRLLCTTLEVATADKEPHAPWIEYNKDKRLLIFRLPPVEILDYDALRDSYDMELTALKNA